MDPQQRADYVERWARILEQTGEARITGRIYAHLATAEEPYLSLQELADQLGVSRASVSTNTRRLIGLGMLTRHAVPGSRGEHYALAPTGAASMIQRAAQVAHMLEELAREGVRLQAGVVTPGTQSLRMMAEVYGAVAGDLERRARAMTDAPPKTRQPAARRRKAAQ
jgi:DNA-binding MarR family transcriptional regulator